MSEHGQHGQHGRGQRFIEDAADASGSPGWVGSDVPSPEEVAQLASELLWDSPTSGLSAGSGLPAPRPPGVESVHPPALSSGRSLGAALLKPSSATHGVGGVDPDGFCILDLVDPFADALQRAALSATSYSMQPPEGVSVLDPSIAAVQAPPAIHDVPGFGAIAAPASGLAPRRGFSPAGQMPASSGIDLSSLRAPTPRHAPGAPAAPAPRAASLDVGGVRGDFPALQQYVNGKPLIWLDNAATTQKPRSVIDTLSHYYERDNSNVHRGAHTLAARATDAYEGARSKVQRFLGAASTREIIFVRGTTEAINLVAQTYGRKMVGADDEIVVTTAEHHSNIVPWQMLAQEKGAKLRVVPLNDRGEVILEEYERLLNPRVRLVAFTHVSNALGTVMPVALMTQMAHKHGARVLVDGAQSVPHFPINVQSIGCDFYAISGHKLFGPTGVGVLYGREDVLREMPPWQGGGNMIESVSFERTTYADLPAKFEAGTGILADAVGLGAAIDYLEHIGFAAASQYEHALLHYGTELLSEIRGLRMIGTAREKAGVLSFVLDGIRSEDMGAYLDREGIAVRSGHHCAQPALRRFGLTATVRASLAFYNTREDLDALAVAVRKALVELR